MNDTTHKTTAHMRRHKRHADIVRWVRKTHSWFGLWGALLGLLFGVSGIWLNHRAVLKLPPVAQQRSNAQIALPAEPLANADAMGRWLQSALQLDNPPNSIRIEPARPVAWDEPASAGDKHTALMQPERWSFSFGGPNATILVDAWVGNRSVSVRRTDNGFLGTLQNLHKGTGMTVPWILLVDTLAGSMIFLSLSGVLLWALTSRRRMVGTLIFMLSAASMLGLIVSRL